MNKWLRGYMIRFTLLHVATYTVVGIVFYQLQDYETALATQAQFELWRPLDDPLVAAALAIQILRGGLLALLIYPFYHTFIQRKQGWLLLFSLMFGLTALGSALLIPDIARLIVTEGTIAPLLVGIPEVATQMLLFSWLLFVWERRAYKGRMTGFKQAEKPESRELVPSER